jgi:predicted nucleic acid-binding protein
VSSTPAGFLDSNIIIYAFTADPRAATAQALLDRGCVTSVQGLNEFANVARRKLAMTWPELHDALNAIRSVCQAILPIDIETHTDALRIAERHGYTIFDALIVAAALRADCVTLWTEDMQDGAVIEERLRIVNPFRAGI